MADLLRNSPDDFEVLIARTAELHEPPLQPGLVEKDYWVTEVLRNVCAPHDHVADVIFKGGTSLSKAFGIIERFSEDIDVTVVPADGLSDGQRGEVLRKLDRRAGRELTLEREVEKSGTGFRNTRYRYSSLAEHPTFLTPGVLLEAGTRGGPAPNERRTIRSLIADVSREHFAEALDDFEDLAAFEVTVLGPERTVAEKLAFLHHRATVDDLDGLVGGARHLYDIACILGDDHARDRLSHHPGGIADLMVDVDARSEAAGWEYTPRPKGGFLDSPAFIAGSEAVAALRVGYDNLDDLVWGHKPSFDESISALEAHGDLL